MTRSICTIEGCGKPVVGRGWCGTHYARWKRHGSPTAFATPKEKRICSIDGCGNLQTSRGWCVKHYSRWLDHGTTSLNEMESGVCSVPGCGQGPIQGQGLCNTHYRRLRKHGSLTLVKTKPSPAYDFYKEVVVNFEADECLIWPFSKNGKGYATIHGGQVHRRLCEETYGPAPTAKHQAAHNCGRRDCVNRRHIRWATIAENAADKIQHGTYGVKLTLGEVNEIKRLLASSMTQKEIAKICAVSQSTVSHIATGKVWSWAISEAA